MITRRSFVEKTIGLVSLPVWMSFTTFNKTFSSSSQEEDLLKIKALLTAKDPLKWVFAGDSITQGAKHTMGYRSYPEIFAERVRWEMKRVRDVVINTAISGNTSADILKDYEWRVAQFAPAVVFIMIGTNDASVKKEISTDRFRNNIEELVSRVRQAGGIPVLQTPNIIITEKATGRERLKDYVPILREVSAAKNTLLVDHWAYWTEKAKQTPDEVYGKWMSDELHPNGHGHDEIAKLLFKKLEIFDAGSFTGSDHFLNG
ncbi:MAG TPA: SGNH/GDSL hydrolase family protein [Chitinophagaceae bacterium]|nr:SGNH/GDSL hydrolase family protein [Chitinophagaceae bacterium]